MESTHSNKSALMRLGIMVALGLALLTIVEYGVATGNLAASFLLIAMIALAKIVLILINFMHIGNIFQGEGAAE
ncbi:MAG: hypothetical protein HZB51_10360 [Chloroflexi bacterium]|nr:hypothetical protein [Chloroflexota bacterium]